MLPGKFDIIIPPQDIICEPGLQGKLANGDSKAFAWVYKNYCKRVYNYALLMTNNSTQSEDIVHDIFIKIWIGEEIQVDWFLKLESDHFKQTRSQTPHVCFIIISFRS